MKYNKTTIYLAAMLEYNLEKFVSDMGFVNCYIGDHSYPIQYKNHMFVRVKPINFGKTTLEIIEETKKHKSFVRVYDLVDNELMFVFKLNDSYEKDIAMFRLGKYSKISREYVNSKFTKDSKRYKVFHKDEKYKAAIRDLYAVRDSSIDELESIPLPEEEIFRCNDLRGWN